MAMGDGTFRKTEPGEYGGKRYTFDTTSLMNLAEFGLGMAGYFYYLVFAIIVCFVITIACIPQMIYFESNRYRSACSLDDPDTIACSTESRLFITYGSAVCTTKADVVGNNKTLTGLACPFHIEIAQYGLGSLIFLCIVVFAFKSKVSSLMTAFDESIQSAQDYSVQVCDPDADANDPDEWHTYFSQFGEVASITVGLSNGPLLRALAQRRHIKLMIEYETPDGEQVVFPDHKHIDVEAGHGKHLGARSSSWRLGHQRKSTATSTLTGVLKARVKRPALEYWFEVWEANHKVLERLYTTTFDVASVFCVFEMESGQRNCLEKLTVGLIPSALDLQMGPEAYRFRGKNELFVKEAPEPSDMVWCNLGLATALETMKQRAVALLYLFLINIACYYAVVFIQNLTGSNLAIAILIALFDQVCI
jgi:hypothetical protein